MRTFTEEEVEEMQYCEKCGYVQNQCECDKPKTNFDRIKAMSVEEFANFAVTHPMLAWDNDINDYEDMLYWLNKEVE